MGAYECFVQTEFGARGHVTKILLAKNGQKVDDFEPIYLGNYRYRSKWFVIFEHTINHLFLGYVCLPQLECYFSFFFFLTFSFLLFFSGYLLLNC